MLKLVKVSSYLVGACLLSLLLASCAPQASAQTHHAKQAASTAGTSPRCPETISIQDFAFNPSECWVDAGDTITFVNNDQAPHTATSDDGSAFDTGTLQPGQSASVTFNTAGSFPYHCNIHPSMQALITVRAAGGAAGDEASDDEVAAEEDDSDSGYGY